MWSIFGRKPREGTEARRVYEEVQRRKESAKEKGIDKLISALFFEKIQYYPSWIQHSRDYVPTVIKHALDKKSEKDNFEKVVEIALFAKVYRFEFASKGFSLPGGEYSNQGLLALYENDRKIFALNCSLEDDSVNPEWRPFDIEAFIEGDWIQDFKKLKKMIEENDETREYEKAEHPDLIEKMKKNFGIE